jgi:glucoamylase
VRVELHEPALVHWSRENWRTSQDVMTTAVPFGMHVVDLDTADLAVGDELVFTLHWNDERRWDEQDFRIRAV